MKHFSDTTLDIINWLNGTERSDLNIETNQNMLIYVTIPQHEQNVDLCIWHNIDTSTFLPIDHSTFKFIFHPDSPHSYILDYLSNCVDMFSDSNTWQTQS